MKKVEDLQIGDWVRWGTVDWQVTDRDLYRESSDYYEMHWKLEAEQGQERYLVMSREQKDAGTAPQGPQVSEAGSTSLTTLSEQSESKGMPTTGTEEMWVCTHQVNTTDVEYRTDSGEWKAFRETDSIDSPPKNVRFDNKDFSLQGETEGTAEDDDGNMVTKLTWDYYDASRSCNLAIEIWKEPDADYFEAYDGRVTGPADFVFLPPRQAPRGNQIIKALKNIFAGIFCVLIFFLPLAGEADIPGEYIVSTLALVSMLIFSSLITNSPGLVITSLLAAGIASAFLIKFRGLGCSYWEYSLYGVSAGFILTWLFDRFYFNSVRHFDRLLAASNSTLLFLWIISFAHYIKFAPQPHNFGSLLAACALPLAPAIAVFLAYKLKGDSDATQT